MKRIIYILVFLLIPALAYAYVVGTPSNMVPGNWQAFAVAPGAPDSGVTSTAHVTLKNLVTAIGTTKKSTIVFPHTGSETTTQYTIGTALDLSSYSNITFQIENGAQLKVSAGVSGVTLPSPSNVNAQPNQQIVSGTSLFFLNGGVVYPQWWGAKADGSTDDSNALIYAWQSCNSSGAIVKLIGNFAISKQQAGLDLYQSDGTNPVNNLTIMADSPDLGKITSSHASPQTAVRYNGTASPITNLTIKNVGFVGNSQYTPSTFTYGWAISIRRGENVNVEGCKFSNWPIGASYFGTYATSGSTNYKFTGNDVSGNASLIGALGTSVMYCMGQCEILNNRFDYIARPIDFEVTSSLYQLGNVSVIGNSILNGTISTVSSTNTYQGIHVLRDYTDNYVSNFVISNNVFSGATDISHGNNIVLSGDLNGISGSTEFKHPIISNNTMSGCTIPVHIALWELDSPTVIGNSINFTASPEIGIQTYRLKDALISNNSFSGYGYYDIVLNGAYPSSGVKLYNNKLSSQSYNAISLNLTANRNVELLGDYDSSSSRLISGASTFYMQLKDASSGTSTVMTGVASGTTPMVTFRNNFGVGQYKSLSTGTDSGVTNTIAYKVPVYKDDGTTLLGYIILYTAP